MEGKITPIQTIVATIGGVQLMDGKLNKRSSIIGTINTICSIEGSLNKIDNISSTISSGGDIKGIFSMPSYISDIYFGDYNITPTKDGQTISTKDKMLKGDICIEQIPYYETSNPTGITVYIGGE